MGSGFVGLDVARCEDLARLAGSVAETIDRIGADVRRWVAQGELVDVGAAARCRETVDELTYLEQLLRAKAVEMTVVSAGGSLATDRLLWASLLDGVGAGVDLDTDPSRTGGVPMSATIAARALARHLQLSVGDDGVSAEDIYDLVDDESVPVDVRAAALFAYRNPDAFEAMFDRRVVTVESLQDFATESAALATLAKGWPRFNRADGTLTATELHAATDDTAGRFTDAERQAARWLLENDRVDAPWKRFDTWTTALVNRQILAEHPDLAVNWVYLAAADPHRAVVEQAWYDQAGADAWLTTTLSSTTDPEVQADLLVRFASIHQATKPDASILQLVHDLLDRISFIDPTQIADALNTAVYTAEGDYENAAISAAGMAVVFGGGKAIRLTADHCNASPPAPPTSSSRSPSPASPARAPSPTRPSTAPSPKPPTSSATTPPACSRRSSSDWQETAAPGSTAP